MIGYIAGGVTAVGTFAIIYQFFGDAILSSNIGWISALYYAQAYPVINSTVTQTIALFNGVESLVFLANIVATEYQNYTNLINFVFDYVEGKLAISPA